MDIDQNQQLLENLIDSVNVPEKVSIKALKGDPFGSEFHIDLIFYGPDRTKFPNSFVPLMDDEIAVQELHINYTKDVIIIRVSADSIYRNIIFTICLDECASDIFEHILHIIKLIDKDSDRYKLESQKLWQKILHKLVSYVEDRPSKLSYIHFNNNPDGLKGHITNKN